MCGSDIFLGLIAVLFPPLAVWIKRGICSADSLINIALCCLGFLPGLIHAWYIIAKYPDPEFEYSNVNDAEYGQGPISRQPGYGTNAPMPRMNDSHGPSQSHPNSQDPEEGGSQGVPPSYQEAVGDHKIQS